MKETDRHDDVRRHIHAWAPRGRSCRIKSTDKAQEPLNISSFRLCAKSLELCPALCNSMDNSHYCWNFFFFPLHFIQCLSLGGHTHLPSFLPCPCCPCLTQKVVRCCWAMLYFGQDRRLSLIFMVGRKEKQVQLHRMFFSPALKTHQLFLVTDS